MVDHLFVYGTLRSFSRRRAARMLRREARSLGLAEAEGRLYDLGAHPGAVFRLGSGTVLGELFALPEDPSELFAALDDYEGLAQHHREGEYRRERIGVRLGDGTRLPAWVYALARAPEARLVAEGDWLAHVVARRARTA